jgi:TonB-linked SusC/RagA family outer membrane protein
VLLVASSLRYVVDADHIVIFPQPGASTELRPPWPASPTPQVSSVSLVSFASKPPVRVQAQQTTVAGVVLDVRTNAPLQGVQITAEGTTRGTTTDAQGRFRIDGLTGTEVTLRVELIGYRTVTQRVRVGDVEIRFALEQTAVGLDQIVVTATGEQRLVEVGSTIARVRADSAVLVAPVTDFAELLSARAAGVFVKTGSGTSIGGSRIRIRGASSPSRNNEPIVYIDGVRVNTDPSSISFATNQQQPSRLNDINPNEIESIDVIKGPSASTMYGTEAANGVILITTKSGAGASRGAEWHVWTEAGRITEPNDYPANWGAVDAQGRSCPLTSQATGTCTQAELRTFNLVEDPSTTVFKTGNRGVLGASVSGASEALNYFVSAEYERENGVYEPDQVRKAFLRGNFTLRPSDRVQVQVSSGYVSSNLNLFADGGTTLGLVTTGWAGTARPDGWFQWTPEQLYQIDSRQHVDRFIGSGTVRVQPAEWLQLRGVVGLDGLWREDQRLFPVGVFTGANAEGTRNVGRSNSLRYSAEFLSRLDFTVTPTVISRTSIGGQYFRDRVLNINSTGTQLVPGTNSLGAAALTSTNEGTTEVRTLGVFLEQQFTFRDRLFLNAGLRSDNNSNFGQDFDVIVYPKVGASWLVSEESFFPTSTLFNSLRLRAAWGESGSQPGSLDAVLFYNASPATAPDGQSRIGVTLVGGGLGNPQLKAERSSEIEFGFDLGLLEDRISLSLTRYDKRTRDALIFRGIAPSVGATTGRWENLAEVENKGYEGSLDMSILERADLDLSLSVSFAYNKNKLVELGEGVAPINTGTQQRHVEGHPLGGYWMRDIVSYDDANGDGIIVANEVTVTDTAVYLGEVTPPFMASIQPAIQLFDLFRVSAVVALNYGHKLYNFTEGFRCNNANSRGRNDITTPLEDQARCVAHALRAVQGGFVHDAGFTKLREVSATFNVPSSWIQQSGLRSASMTVAGQNLGTWTDYPGVDPDISSRGSNFEMVDFFQPASRRVWIARLNVSF